jgi:ubiquinone/menaquinone biosynthesis C-methylase UbiE
VARRNLTNVRLVLGTEADPKLSASIADLVLIANAYHEFSHPAEVMDAVHRALKPNGRVVVLEYAEEKADDDPVAGLYRMRLTQLRAEIESQDFQLDRILDFLPMQHGLVFNKKR